ncbi:CRE-NPP-1 protein [Caenorhabditis remanei]|uniref:CRE-NPP-1 protein n=1 Tax=Caenorhabditis remanei TaxID=31234 RepID=E3MLX3_CAERE|nr:CRE-NPP-1 protein [Caenorhabditis remanei]
MSLFGSSTPQKPAFTFPTPSAPATSAGSLFGNTTPAKPLFGSTTQASSTPSLFGTTTTSTPSGGLFGKSGTTTTTTSSAGTLFGAAPTTTTTPSLFGSSTPGLFGTSGVNNGGLGGGGTSSGATTTSKPSVATKMDAFRSGNLGSKTLSQTTSFASPSTSTTSAPSMSLLTPSSGNLSISASRPPSSNFNPGGSTGFGSTGTTGGSLFGSNAAKPASTGLFGSSTAKPAPTGLFGSSSSGFGVLGTTQQQQPVIQQQQVVQISNRIHMFQSYHPFVRACGDPKILGNDNDGTIAKLNQVSASLGVGKAPYKDGNQIQTFSMEGNLFEKFKGIGYNKISERTDDEGFVTLVLRHPIENLNTEDRREKILEVVKTILASGPNVEVRYAPGTSLRPLPEGFTEICIIAKEGGFVASAIKLAQALNDAPKLAQLEAQLQVDKTRVLPKVGMSKAQRDRYLETVPDGYDEQIWKQAIRENPAPNKYLPVPVRGWEELRDRQRAQVGESKLYNEAIQSLSDRVEFTAVGSYSRSMMHLSLPLQNEHARAIVAMENIRNRHKTLSYRIIRVLLAQWIAARFSRQIDTDENIIEGRCDTLLAQLNRDYQIKFYVDKFYEVLETKPDKLQESMWTTFDMTLDDEHFARKTLTKFINLSCNLYEMAKDQRVTVEAMKNALEG